jgi:Conserved TM helix
MTEQMDIVMQSLSSFWTNLAAFIPQALGALILLIIGWGIAKALRGAAVHILKAVKFDKLSEKSGIEAFLRQGNLTVTLSSILCELIYWLVILVVIVTVANSLGLQMVADLFNKIALYIPNIIAAVLVLVFGTLLARLINRTIFAYLNNIGVEGALTLSTLAEYAIIVFVFFVALEQLQIGVELLTSAFQIGFGAICLALALAFGMAGRDWAASVIERCTKKK